MEKRILNKQNLMDMLANLNTDLENLVIICARPDSFPSYINRLLSGAMDIPYAKEIREAVNNESVFKETEKYRTGAVIYWNGPRSKHLLLPPFPITEDKILTGNLDTSLLREALENRYTIGVVLITWGSYAVGVFHEGNLLESRVGAGYIHKKHKKGGRSQKRFARRTEEQRKDFIRKVSNRIKETFQKHTLDSIFFGGNRLIRKPLLQECRYLELEAHKISGRVLDIRSADMEILSHSLSEIMKSVAFSF